MTPPFIQGTGRLAASRQDFQNHVDGYSFPHNASIIQLSPAIVIIGTPYTNVAAAIAALNSTISASMLAGDADGYLLTNTVLKINGVSLPTSGPHQTAGVLQTGNVLQVTGPSTLGYAPINLSGGSSYIIGALPTGNQSPQSMGGDVTGTTGASVVTKLQGNAVASGTNGASQDGYVLTWKNATSQYQVGPMPLVGDIDGYNNATVVASIATHTTTNVGASITSPTVPQLQVNTIAVGINIRTWLQTIPDPAINAVTNIYKNNSTGGYEIASNCRWTGTAWSCYTSTDGGGTDAGLTSIGSSGTNLVVQTKSTTGLTPFITTWTDTYSPGSGWDYYMQSSYSNMLIFGNVAAGSEFQNTLYPNNIPKAWASFTLTNAPLGNSAIYALIPGTDGNFFNCSVIFSSVPDDSTDNMHVTFVNAMQDASYSIDVNFSDIPLNNGGPPSSTSMLFPQVINKSPTSFDIIAVGFDGTQYPFNTAYNQGFSSVDFVIMGLQ